MEKFSAAHVVLFRQEAVGRRGGGAAVGCVPPGFGQGDQFAVRAEGFVQGSGDAGCG